MLALKVTEDRPAVSVVTVVSPPVQSFSKESSRECGQIV